MASVTNTTIVTPSTIELNLTASGLNTTYYELSTATNVSSITAGSFTTKSNLGETTTVPFVSNGQDWLILVFVLSGILIPLLSVYIAMKIYLCRRDGCYNGCFGMKGDDDDDTENLTSINNVNFLHNKAYSGEFFHGKKFKKRRKVKKKTKSDKGKSSTSAEGLGAIIAKKSKGIKKRVKTLFKGSKAVVPMKEVEVMRPLPPIPPV